MEWLGKERIGRSMKVKKYLPSASSRISQKDAEAIGHTLDVIEEAGHGDQMPEELLRRSRSERSPTHHLFTWDDQDAAEAYRLIEARELIRSIEIVFEETGSRVRAFPSVQIGDGERNYMSMGKVLSREDYTRRLVEDARLDAEAWARRHEALRKVAELSGVFGEIDRLVKTGRKGKTAMA
jgi:hypothetical protein